ncbi:MAG: M13 family peptidase [Schleiferiaceae bacterium]
MVKLKRIAQALPLAGLVIVGCQEAAPEKTVDPNAYPVADMHTESSPCTDFFTYAGGGWIENNPIPDSEANWSKFNMLWETNQKKIRVLFQELAQSEGQEAEKYRQVVKDMYITGMDSAAAEAMGLEPIQGLLDAVEEDANTADLMAHFARVKAYGVSSPLGYYIGADEKNSSLNTMYLYQSGLSLPDKSYYQKTDSVSVSIQEAYVNHIEKMLSLANPEDEDARSKAERIYALESKMADLQMDRVDLRSPEKTYNPYTYEKLQSDMSNMDWKSYFAVLGMEPSHLIVNTPDYLMGVSEMLADPNLLEDWKLYNRFKVINAFASYLPHDYVQADFDFYGKVLSGQREMKPRWKRVQSDLNGGLSQEVGRIYVAKHFPEEDKAKISAMVEDLRSAYEMRISELAWMSPETKSKALEKLKTFTYKIGYPDSWKSLDGLTILSTDYVGNLMNLRSFRAAENLADYNQPVDKSRWGMGAHIVNAYYNPSNNEIVFPAGILQPPFYNPNADDALNYGGIGGVIGHEFTHGFDDQGSKYDAYGNLSDWWTEEDRAAFDKLAEALAAQYDAYEPLPGIHVDGHLTLGENIADLGGLTLTYHAYKMSHPEDAPLVNGFTAEQRIFLGWAQAFTGHATEGYLRQQVVADPHSPAKYRVIGPTANIPEFYQSFKCDQPADIIEIW